MDTQKKFDLIARNTEEILTRDDLSLLLKERRQLSAYIGLATTGPFHMGYFVPFGKMLDFDKAGIKNKILIADVHSALDDLKTKWDELERKSEYYHKCIELGFPWGNKPEFVLGSSFQFDKGYHKDLLKLSTLITVARATRAASEVTRMKSPKVSELIYPLMQSLDEECLKVDIQLGGIDQRHILTLAREYLPQIGYRKRVEIMTPLIVSLKGPGVKMSASVPETNIKVYESEEGVRKKINKAYCPEGEIKDNPILQLFKHIIFPLYEKVKIERDAKFGGDVVITSYEDFETSFAQKKIHPLDAKRTLSEQIIKAFAKARAYFEKNKDLLRSLGEQYL